MTDNIFDDIKVKFEQFISLVGNVLAHEKEIYIIQNKLRRHFNTTSSSYLCSTNFLSLLNQTQNWFNKNHKSTKYFTLLASLDEQLKKHSIKLLGSHRLSNESSSSDHKIESIKTSSSSNENPVITSDLKLSSSTDQPSNSCDNISLTSNESQLSIAIEGSEINTNSVNICEYEAKRKRKISKLERRLSGLSKIIRELEEKELSLDEMQFSDLYLIESNLKKRAYEIFTKLAELKNQSTSAERILDEPVTLTEIEIDHPLINKALQDMVNQIRCLPSFNDVVNTVDKTNDKYELKLSIDARKNLAEKSFQIIGTKIKTRRMADFHDIMNSRLPEDFDIQKNDPALDNIEIENTLLENQRQAVIKTEQIFEEFSRIDPYLEPEINIESSEESPVETDEEEKGEEEEEQNDADDDETESESKTIIQTLVNKFDETDYDIVDILPPFSPKFSPSSPPNVTEPINGKDPVKSTSEISLIIDNTFKVSRTASIPVKRAARYPFISQAQNTEPEVYTLIDDDDDDDIQESQPISITQEHKADAIIVLRRRQQQQEHTSNKGASETSYNISKQRISSNDLTSNQKRSLNEIDYSNCKKRKDESEIVILD